MYYADSQAFLAIQGQPPIFDPEKRPRLSLALVTSVPHFVKDFHTVLAAHEVFRDQALSNPDTHEVRGKRDLDWPGMGILFGLQCPPDRMTYERARKLAYEAGIRAMTLAFDEATEYGGGFLAKGGLTKRGMQLIKWMDECGIILDLSHSNHETAREALDFIGKSNLQMKPMASHTGCYEVFRHPRNLPDDVLQRIVRMDGYIGINLISFLLCRRHERGHGALHYLSSFVSHVRHVTQLDGADCYKQVGVGSDCPHLDQTTKEAEKNYLRLVQMLKTGGAFGEYFPDRPPEVIERGSKMMSIFRNAGEDWLFRGPLEDDYIYGRSFRAFLERSFLKDCL